MGFLNEFLLGDFPHTVKVGAVAAGHQRHRSPTGLRGKARGEETKRLAGDDEISCQVTSSFKSLSKPASDT